MSLQQEFKMSDTCLRFALVVMLLMTLGCGGDSAQSTIVENRSTPPAPILEPSFEELRNAFTSERFQHGPSPQAWEDDAPLDFVEATTYPSEVGNLKAWLAVPKQDRSRKWPAVIYLHGGFAYGNSDFADAMPFLDAGYVLMCPTVRGENGNPGEFEMFLGELDDTKSAIKWLAMQPYVDSSRIYVFGHSSGGVLSAMLSLVDVPICHSGSSGGLYGPDLFRYIAFIPFDLLDSQECQMRVPVGNLKWMKRKHFAYVGNEDGHMRASEALAEAAPGQLTVVNLEGNHGTSLPAAVQEYIAVIEADKQNAP